MAVVHSTLWNSVKELLLEQYKSSPNLKAVIQAVVEECAQPLEDAAFDLNDFLDLGKATGKWLDTLGKLVHLERNIDEDDSAFRRRIEVEANKNVEGTPDFVIGSASILSGDAAPHYLEEAPATFFVYTPNGTQLKRKQVKKLAPAGVLGLPGAAIRLGNGNLLSCANGKRLLTVARDYKKMIKALLVTDDGKALETDDGKMLYALIDA